MEWQEISRNWVYLPHNRIVGIIHFLGGAFVATAPQISYRCLLEQIAQEGYIIIATPFINTFDHFLIAREVLNSFETVIERLKKANRITKGYLPVYGLGHSMGCKLHLLISSLYQVERSGNILISFNNYPAAQAVPLLEQFNIRPIFEVEFDPSPLETQKIIVENYSVRRNLLIKFDKDNLDQTLILNHWLKDIFPKTSITKTLIGNHLTPLNQKISWQTGKLYTPMDAIGQWLNQSMSRNLERLKQEMVIWLNPMSAF